MSSCHGFLVTCEALLGRVPQYFQFTDHPLSIDSVVSTGGIGWHWGVGIDAIIYPLGVASITIIMLVLQRRAKALGAQLTAPSRPRPTTREVCSALDLGGLSLAIVSLGFILVPLSLAALQPQGYRTPWIIALFVLGPLGLLIALPLYESHVAATPFFPGHYLRNRPIALAFALYFLDFMAAAASHSYLYNWALIAQNMTPLQAVYLSYTNGVTIVFVGLVFGWMLWRTRRFKWPMMAGCAVRLLGYGLMFRVRAPRTSPSYAELFVVQCVQGLGDGLVQTGAFVVTTANVPHAEAAQMTALTVLVGILGQSVGDAISGAVYTGTFRSELRRELGSLGTPEMVETVFNSITGAIPAWGTVERMAINRAVCVSPGLCLFLM